VPTSLSTLVTLAYLSVQGRRLYAREPKLFVALATTLWPLARTCDELVEAERPLSRGVGAYWALYIALHLLERVRVRVAPAVAGSAPAVQAPSLLASQLRRLTALVRTRLPSLLPARRRRFPEPSAFGSVVVIGGQKARQNALAAIFGPRWRIARTVFLLWAMSDGFAHAALVLEYVLRPVRTWRRLRDDARGGKALRKKEVRLVDVEEPTTDETVAAPAPAPLSPPPSIQRDVSAPSTPRQPHRRMHHSPHMHASTAPLARSDSTLDDLALDDAWSTEVRACDSI